MTIGEAVARFDAEWIAAQATTPRYAYRRTLSLLALWLERSGRGSGDDLASLSADDLGAVVAWHASSGLVDDADGSRKVAVHLARLGAFLAVAADRPDLAVDRDTLRARAV